MKSKSVKTLNLALSAVFAALVCIATMIFTVYVPLTRGFFNIGETMVYTSALLFGPYVGAFAGGVGSMLADLLLGYPHYAPATLVIKALEGFIVGSLSRIKPKRGSASSWKIATVIIGILAGFLLAFVGATLYSGRIELYLGYPPPEKPNLVMYISPYLWYTLGAIITIATSCVGLIFEAEFGWIILCVLVGGSEMVLGYFLYEQLILGVVAIGEIPINIMQMIVGLIVSIPLVRALWRIIPQFKPA